MTYNPNAIYGFRVIEKATLMDITDMYDWYLKPNGDIGYISDKDEDLPDIFILISKIPKEKKDEDKAD